MPPMSSFRLAPWPADPPPPPAPALVARASSATDGADSDKPPLTPAHVPPSLLRPSVPSAEDYLEPDGVLPPPVLATLARASRRTRSRSGAGSTSTKHKKSARIDSANHGLAGLRVHWARFVKRLGTGTSPSTPSDSLVEESAGGDSSTTTRRQMRGTYEEGDEVDEVVVDRQWSEELKSSVSASEQDGTPNKTGSHAQGGGGTATDHDSLALHATGVWALCTPLIVLRWRVWPAVLDFFSLRFFDAKSEAHFAREHWYTRKALAVWAAFFLALNWLLGVIFLQGPRVAMDRAFYYGFAPALTFPVLLMIMYDFPRDRPVLYQVWLTVAVWMWPVYQVLFIHLCGFYNKPSGAGGIFTCGTKDFLGTFYYACGLPTIALFGLRMKRFPALCGGAIWTGLAIGLILPERSSWVRNVLNFDVFILFLLYVHHALETAERRLYTLREQLKIQFRATQKAQVNERKAGDSKRRLTSYVFHEVRVPLNTALLAVQNMEASGVVPRAQEIEFKALAGSLSMMSKVLNDVLDFNRMDSGRFESVSKPYCFHQVMRSLFVPLRLAADARGLKFVTDLDVRIDRVARLAALSARGLSPDAVLAELAAAPDADGTLVGDETRLMQIITNLASNACKFTPPGGTLTVATRLIVPSPAGVWTPSSDKAHVGGDEEKGEEDGSERTSGSEGGDVEKGVEEGDEEKRAEVGNGARLSANTLGMHNLRYSKPPEVVVVRIEVQDTGYGIPPKEMEQSKLFSAFNQTEQGKQQGGKGTGLGLALVRQIVKRSGGRLGVISKVGKGSTFWVELPLGVGAKALATPATFGDAFTAGDSLARGLMSNATAGDIADAAPSPDARSSSGMSSSPPPRAASAMQSLMEQGGFVELAPKSGDSSSVITRTIHDTVPGALSTTPLASTPEDEPAAADAELTPPTAPFASGSTAKAPSSAAASDDGARRPPSPASGVSIVPSVRMSMDSGRRRVDGRIELPPPLFAQDNGNIHGNGAAPLGSDSSASSTAVGSDRPGLSQTSSLATKARDSPEPPLPPQHAASPKPPARASPVPSPPQAKDASALTPGLPVLVVDDDPLTRMLMSRLLTRLGCKVATAENGEIALEMILDQPAQSQSPPQQSTQPYAYGQAFKLGGLQPRPSPASEQPSIRFMEEQHERESQRVSKYAVVFLDNQMPVMSGLTTVARLREMGRQDFVVGVTGNALLSDQEEYIEAGVDHVLTKPVLERSLKAMLLEADERRKQRQAMSTRS